MAAERAAGGTTSRQLPSAAAAERAADAAPFDGAFSYARVHSGVREHMRFPRDDDAVVEAIIADDRGRIEHLVDMAGAPVSSAAIELAERAYGAGDSITRMLRENAERAYTVADATASVAEGSSGFNSQDEDEEPEIHWLEVEGALCQAFSVRQHERELSAARDVTAGWSIEPASARRGCAAATTTSSRGAAAAAAAAAAGKTMTMTTTTPVATAAAEVLQLSGRPTTAPRSAAPCGGAPRVAAQCAVAPCATAAPVELVAPAAPVRNCWYCRGLIVKSGCAYCEREAAAALALALALCDRQKEEVAKAETAAAGDASGP